MKWQLWCLFVSLHVRSFVGYTLSYIISTGKAPQRILYKVFSTEGHSKGHLIFFFHWKGTLKGTFSSLQGTSEGTTLCFLHWWALEREFYHHFFTGKVLQSALPHIFSTGRSPKRALHCVFSTGRQPKRALYYIFSTFCFLGGYCLFVCLLCFDMIWKHSVVWNIIEFGKYWAYSIMKNNNIWYLRKYTEYIICRALWVDNNLVLKYLTHNTQEIHSDPQSNLY